VLDNNLIVFTPKELINSESSGKITDARTGEALAGVYIRIEGTNAGAVSDANGNYSINFFGGCYIAVHYVGYNPETVAVAGRSQIDVAWYRKF